MSELLLSMKQTSRCSATVHGLSGEREREREKINE